jgi:hypothetical protein
MNTTTYTFDENILSDLHKDAYGFRPSEIFFREWDLLDDDGKQDLWDQLVNAVGDSILEEKRQHEMAIFEFESWVQMTMKIVLNSTREDCIRMMHDMHKTYGDVGYLEHCLGVPYGYLSGKNRG